MTSLPYFPDPPQNYVAAGPPLLSCGLDLGQRNDPTALAVLEAADLMAATPDPVTWERAQVRHFGLRHLERLPLGTPYTEVAARVRDVLLALRQAGRVTLTVDATGVGAPVVDLLRREFERSGFSCGLMPVVITAGLHPSVNGAGGRCTVPKRDLIQHLELLLEQHQLRIAVKMPEAATLRRELGQFHTRPSGANHDLYGAWREGEHDDLVLATALAAWRLRGSSTFGVQQRTAIY